MSVKIQQLNYMMNEVVCRVLEKNLSHKKSNDSLSQIIEKKRAHIESQGHLHDATVEQQLELLDQVSQSELGSFLLERRGLNGFWTDFINHHPTRGRLSGLNRKGESFSALEDFLLNKAPIALAMQERFQIFKREIQKRVHEGIRFASVPCGLMSDLLELDYTSISEFSLFGIDIDSESFEHAENLAKEKRLLEHCKFLTRDAWELNFENEIHLITSNGLNFYEPDDEKVVKLYQKFYNSLKSGGCLITSFLTLPPGLPIKTEWDISKVQLKDALFQKLLLKDILDVSLSYRTQEQTKKQLEQAGFGNIEFIFDDAHIFPTVIATKL